ncbi:MAG TPA: cyclase family protein [Bacillota bacterium]|nr:cyclase family protein [Bacillota bacterium]HPT87508.1 cyclase family protein [Bacillota bacterium]
MGWFDLSHPIDDGIPAYPGDPRPRLERIKELTSDGYVAYQLQCGMHIGTHVDAPMHLVEGGKRISEIPVEHFMGKAVLVDVRGRDIIHYHPDYQKKIAFGDIVLFYTGWDRYYGEDRYYREHPVLDRKLAEFLIEKRVKLIGLDMPSPDKAPFEIHKLLLTKDIFIIENLTGLGQLEGKDSIELIAIPLKIHAEASLVRVIARISFPSETGGI